MFNPDIQEAGSGITPEFLSNGAAIHSERLFFPRMISVDSGRATL
jgi:hypothetical protein